MACRTASDLFIKDHDELLVRLMSLLLQEASAQFTSLINSMYKCPEGVDYFCQRAVILYPSHVHPACAVYKSLHAASQYLYSVPSAAKNPLPPGTSCHRSRSMIPEPVFSTARRNARTSCQRRGSSNPTFDGAKPSYPQRHETRQRGNPRNKHPQLNQMLNVRQSSGKKEEEYLFQDCFCVA